MKKLFALAMILGALASAVWAEEAEEEKLTRVAIFEISAVDKELASTAEKIAPLLQAAMSSNRDIELVERERLGKIMEEQGLNLAVVDEDDAVKVAKLAGANVLVTGRVFELDEELVFSTKIIGVETSRVFAKVVKGKLTDRMGPLVTKMAEEIGKVVVAKKAALFAKKSAKPDPVKDILKIIEVKKLSPDRLPRVAVKVSERHVDAAVPDPAVESEIMGLLSEAGFKIYDSKDKMLSDWANAYMKDGTIPPKSAEKIDVMIVGEAFSEDGAIVHGIASSKGRIEIKAVDNKTGEVLAVGRITHREVDNSRMMAAKAALVNGTRKLAPDFVDRMLTAWVKTLEPQAETAPVFKAK